MLAGATRYGFGLGRCHSTLRPRRVAAPARTRRRRWLPPAVQSRRHPLRALRSWRLLNITSRSSRRSFGAVGRPILQLWGASRGCWVCCQRRILPCHADVARMRHPQFCCAGKTNLLLAKTCCGGIQPNTMRWDFFGNFRARFLKFPKFLAKIVGNSIYSMIRGMYIAFCTR